jgi:multicomponent Na+:H+ antiporter subunit B
VLAAAIVLVYLAAEYRAFRRIAPLPVVDFVEGTGAGGYVVVGIVALLSGLAFLENLTGPGKLGTLLSGGSIPLLNWASGLGVAAAMVLLFAEFLEEYVAPLARPSEPTGRHDDRQDLPL